jgi:hypothetical protein
VSTSRKTVVTASIPKHSPINTNVMLLSVYRKNRNIDGNTKHKYTVTQDTISKTQTHSQNCMAFKVMGDKFVVMTATTWGGGNSCARARTHTHTHTQSCVFLSSWHVQDEQLHKSTSWLVTSHELQNGPACMVVVTLEQ